MPMTNTQERMVHLCTQFQVNAVDGVVDIAAMGSAGSLTLSGNLVQLNSPKCFFSMNTSEEAGFIQLSTAVGAPESAITLVANGEVNAAQCTVSPQGILLMYGAPEALGYIQVADGEMILGMGPSLSGSLIALTPESITLKVGETTLTLTAEGIVSSSGATTVAVTPEGITEESGPVARALGMEGHTLEAGEAALAVEMSGLVATGPSGSLVFDASGEVAAAMLSESGDAILAQEAAMVSTGP